MPVKVTTAAEPASRTGGHLDAAPEELYDAFISYSRKADEPLAAAIQRGLGSLAKPWYRRRALRIFRDKTNLAASPEGWPSLVAALEGSRYFVLLASPEAAQSSWVDKEVAWWREHRGADSFLIAVTGGEFVWDDQQGDFDPSTQIPPSLRGWFKSVPFWADFRFVRGEKTFDLKDPRIVDPLADVAAPLRRMGKDELVGEDIAQHRRALHQAWAVAGLLMILTVGAVIAAVVAIHQRREAIKQRDIAQARALAATSNAELASDPLAGLKDALASLRIRQTPQGDDALRAALASPLRRLLNPTKRVNGLAFSPDGQYLAAAQRVVTVWNLRGHGAEGLGGHHAAVDVVDFSQTGGKVLTVAEDDTARVWSSPQRPPTLIRFRELGSGALAPDGSKVALSSFAGSVELFDSQGHPIRNLPARPGVSYTNLQFSPDGGHLLGQGNDGTVQIWPVSGTGRAVTLSTVHAAAERITASNAVVTLSASGALDVWSLSGTPQRSAAVGRFQVAAISPDGSEVALGAADGTVAVVDAAGDAQRILGRHPGGDISAMTFSPDGRSLATAAEGDTLVRLWDLRTAPPFVPPGGPFYAQELTFSPNGALVAGSEALGNDVAVWSRTGGSRRMLHNGPAGLLAIGFDRSGTAVTTVADDGIERSLPVSGGRPTIERTGLGSPDLAVVSPDSTLVATAKDNGPLRVWRSNGGPPVTLQARIPTVSEVVFSPNSRRIAVTDQSGMVKVFSVAGGSALALRAPVPITLPAFSPDGNAVAGGSEGTGRVYLWPRLQVGERPTLLGRHLHFVNAVAFSPVGNQVASGGDDGQLRIWRLDGGPALALPSGQASVDAVAFDPLGYGIVTSGNKGGLGLWPCEFCGSTRRVMGVAQLIADHGGLS